MSLAPTITIFGNLEDILGDSNEGSLIVTLCGFGPNLPRIYSGPMISAAKVNQAIEVDADGNFSFQIWGNDVILPGPMVTFYQITILDANGNVVQTNAYQFSGTGSYNLSTIQPITPPTYVPNIEDAVVTNPTALQAIATYPLVVPELIATELLSEGAVEYAGAGLVGPGASLTCDASKQCCFQVLLNVNTAISLINAIPGQPLTFVFVQLDGGGFTVTFTTGNVLNIEQPDTTDASISVQGGIVCPDGNWRPTGPQTVN
jgi:hypothetical protein